MQQNQRGAYLHFAHDRSQDWDFLRAWEPNVLHLMVQGSHTDPNSVSVEVVRRCHETSPSTTILLRCWDVDDRRGEAKAAMAAAPWQEAEKQIDWWSRVIDRCTVAGVPRDQMMAGMNNETPPEMDGALYPYSERALSRATSRGFRIGVGVFSVGRPGLPGESFHDMTSFSRLELLINANRGALLLNEYMQPEGMYAVWTDEHGIERRDWGYLMGRHKRWPMKVPIIIGEWGIEGLLYNRHKDPTYGHSGWLNFKDIWTPERLANEYVAYCRMASDYVIGVCGFISDWADKTWQSFDFMPAYAALLERKELCVRTLGEAPGGGTIFLPDISNGPSTPPATQPQATVPPLHHPLPDPKQRVVTQDYGPSLIDYSDYVVDGVPVKGHTGLDFGAASNSAVGSVDKGRVVEVANQGSVGYGIYTKVSHVWGESLYAHLAVVLVEVGQEVQAGQLLARSDNTGRSSGPHLHFAMRVIPFNRRDGMGGYTDPAPYLARLEQPVEPSPVVRPVVRVPLALVKQIAASYTLDWRLVASHVLAESSFNVNAESEAGAMGLLQITPPTWAEWAPVVNATDPWNAEDNLKVGIKYLTWLLERTGGDVWRALVAYGWGIGNLESGDPIPPKWSSYATKILFAQDFVRVLEIMEI